jgi:hypothetical protein
MAGRTAGPQERRPPEIQVPRLSQEELQRRATAGYDRAVDSILSPQIRQLRTDVTELRNAIMQRQRALPPDASEAQRSQALTEAINAFIERKPNSPLSRFIAAGNDVIEEFSYSFSGRQINITLRLNQAGAESWLRSPFEQAKANVVARMIEASEPVPAGQSRSFYAVLMGMDQRLAQQLTNALMRQVGTPQGGRMERDRLPITIAYTTQRPAEQRSETRLREQYQAMVMEYSGPRPAGRI